jgi:putative tryptophan/tyrosine transport system substrate-binding protein
MRKRDFIKAIGASVAWPVAAFAQQSKNTPTVGVLWHAGNAEEEDVYLSVLVKALNDLGYVEGKNIHLDHRFPAENPERFRTFEPWGRQCGDAISFRSLARLRQHGRLPRALNKQQSC